MNQLQKQVALVALTIGTRYGWGHAAPPAPAKAPQLVGKTITVTCKVTPKAGTTTGVILAQGGEQRGYTLYLVGGKPVFAVRQAGQLYMAKSSKAVTGTFSLEAHLQKDGAMTLVFNGAIVGRGKAPGLFALQPKDGLSVGQDSMSAVGDYKAPNAFKGTVTSVKISTK